jgi:hypothetical protein
MRTFFFQQEARNSSEFTGNGFSRRGARYRLYVLDNFDGRIRSFHEINADSDAAAVKAAERSRGNWPMVLWSGACRVQRWEGLSVSA